MEYALLAACSFLVALGGGLVGLVLGNLRLPIVLLLASSPAAGAGANIAISGVAAATASVAHLRAGRINWRLFAWMAPPTIAGGLAGGYLSGVMPRDLLVSIIAAVLVLGAIELLRWRKPPGGVERRHGAREAGAAVAVGVTIGLLGGIVGLILGSLRMPALIRIVGEGPTLAVGTNTLLGCCLAAAGVVGHLGSAAPDWDLFAIGAAASIPGAYFGSRLTGRLSEERLVQAIAVALLIAATGLVVSSLT